MDSSAWDEICIDPHREARERGGKEGWNAGEIAGYQDGMNLGLTKGLEYGLELGYIQGVCEGIGESQDEKVEKTVETLLRLISEFAQPDYLFNEKSDSNQNLQESMQRIKAKFKVLSIQLKKSRTVWLLKDVLSGTDMRNNQDSREW